MRLARAHFGTVFLASCHAWSGRSAALTLRGLCASHGYLAQYSPPMSVHNLRKISRAIATSRVSRRFCDLFDASRRIPMVLVRGVGRYCSHDRRKRSWGWSSASPPECKPRIGSVVGSSLSTEAVAPRRRDAAEIIWNEAFRMVDDSEQPRGARSRRDSTALLCME